MPYETSLLHTFKHDWKEIALASWKKYPCKSRPDILSVDMIRRDYNPVTRTLSSTRLITNKSQVPFFIGYVIGERSSVSFFVEESTVDPVNKVMVMRSRNLSFSNFIQVHETCTYTPSPENDQWTMFKQDVSIKVVPYERIPKLTQLIEDVSIKKFTENAQKGRQIMEQTIAAIKKEAEATFTKLTETTTAPAT